MDIASIKKQASKGYWLGLFCLIALVFSQTLFFEFVWDDLVLLVGQESYQSAGLKQLLFSSLNGLEYLPLRDLTYVADYWLWGWNPFGFHFTNLILYCLNIWAVYELTFILSTNVFKRRADEQSLDATRVALITAAVFSVLPVHSEVVSFIHCRNVLLSGLFFFLSSIFFLKFIETNRVWTFFVSFLAFGLALLSKATVIILPLILLSFLYFKQARLRHYTSTLPFIILAIGFFFLYTSIAYKSNIIIEENVMVFGSYDFLSKLTAASQIPFFYLSKLFLPVGLSTEYDIQLSRNFFSTAGLISLVSLGVLFTITFFFKNKFPQALFALCWFLICLIPVLNFFLTNPVVADRYVYLSSYAYAYILAFSIYRIGQTKGKSLSLALLIPILMIYSWLSYERNGVWQSQLTVMEDMIKSSPNNVKGYLVLGEHYFQQRQFSKALEYFQQAKEISPANPELEYYQARLANMQHQPEKALELLDVALRLEANNVQAWILRGEIQELQGDLVSAARSFQKSLDGLQGSRSSKEYATSKLNTIKSQLMPLLDTMHQSVENNPDNFTKRAEYAITLQNAGFREEALEQYKVLIQLAGPKWEVYYNLGLLYTEEKEFEKALESFHSSLSLNTESGMIHNELGVLYKLAGQFEKSINHFNLAIELDPTSAKPLINLARLYFQLGDVSLATETFQRVRANFPEYEALAREYLQRVTH